MANTTWKQVVLDTADAYREANGSTEKIPVGSLADKVRAGAGTPYTGDNPLTIGQAGYTFPAKTLLKDGLQIINGVNGEDLTDTAADQTTAVTELMKMVNRKIAMNNGEGQYVWKKYEYHGITVETISTQPITVKMVAQVGDLSKVDASFFAGWEFATSAGGGFVLNAGGTGRYTTSSGTGVDITWSYNPATQYITTSRELTSTTTTFDIGTMTLPEHDYVVSSDTEAYPNGGVLDGYWYELVEEGVSGIDFGVVTFTGSVATFNAEHNLGVTPSYVGIFCPQTVDSTSATRAIFDLWYVKGTTVTSKTVSKDATSVKFYNGYYFAPNVPYVWVAIA